MVKERITPTDHLLTLAEHYISDASPAVKQAIEVITENKAILSERDRIFDEVLNRLSYYLYKPEALQHVNKFPNFLKLRKSIPDEDFWLSSESVAELSYGFYHDYASISFDSAKAFLIAEKTFKEVSELIKSGEWGYINSQTPEVMSSALLIEGYGLYLEKRTKIAGLRSTFVCAFEEILGTEYKDSSLWQDIKHWVLEEKDKFALTFIEGV